LDELGGGYLFGEGEKMKRQIAFVMLGAILLLITNLHAGIYTNTADINNDHRVDMGDLFDFSAAYLTQHTPDPNWNPACDIADPADGNVNDVDLLVFAAQWLWSGAIPDPNQWVFIPSGEFLMGDHHDGMTDAPVHAVYVDSFYMSRYEETNQQYCDYLNSAYSGQIKVVSGVVYASTDTGNSYPYCDTHSADADSQIDFSGSVFSVITKPEAGGRNMSNDPMVEVSWYGAVAYCDYYGYRLPTEAEWEYAARGGEHSPYYRFPWGDTISHSQANYTAKPGTYAYDVSPTSNRHPLWNGVDPDTSPVGFFDGTLKYKVDYNWPGSDTSYQTTSGANGYGLYDMAGNVWEWCNDWSDVNYYATSPYDNPQGPAYSPYSGRVLRGGCWQFIAYYCRVAYRIYYSPDTRLYYFGFRIVLDLE